jgi:limonene-1,2-epoxide hydrolase
MKIDARTESERANARLVGTFVAGWMAEDFDLAREYTRYLHPDAEVRMSEEHPMLHGAQATIAAMQAFNAAGGAVKSAETEEIYARGPLVVTVRTDVVTIPDQGDQVFKIAATFIVKEGRITEWAEFFI